MELSIIEWNIHLMAKSIELIPKFVSDKVLGNDIIVLVEYKKNDSFEKILIENGYDIFSNSPQSKNEVLIAIRKELIQDDTVPAIVTSIPILEDEIMPNFCHVNFIDICGHLISVIGVRKIDKLDFSKQLLPLARYMNKIYENNNLNHYVFTTGDFNAVNNEVAKLMNTPYIVQSPTHDKSKYFTDYYIDNYSYFFVSDNKTIIGMNALDHIISNIKTECLSYSWDFLYNEGYPATYGAINKGKTYWSINRGLPDHAMLTAKFKL